MATKKGGGVTRQGGHANPRFDGVKIFGGQIAKAGAIIVRQMGNKFHSGPGTIQGRNFTIQAGRNGVVKFRDNIISVV